MRRNRLTLVLLLLIAGAAVASWLSAKPSSTFENATLKEDHGLCVDKPGVGLVVDFGSLQPAAAPLQKCVTASETLTGWTLFDSAKVNVTGTSVYPTGFVCRIDGLPTAADAPCDQTPSAANGTWAYFFANRATGFKWMFSGAGAAMRHPACGEVDGWRFESPGDPAKTPPSTQATATSCG